MKRFGATSRWRLSNVEHLDEIGHLEGPSHCRSEAGQNQAMPAGRQVVVQSYREAQPGRVNEAEAVALEDQVTGIGAKPLLNRVLQQVGIGDVDFSADPHDHIRHTLGHDNRRTPEGEMGLPAIRHEHPIEVSQANTGSQPQDCPPVLSPNPKAASRIIAYLSVAGVRRPRRPPELRPGWSNSAGFDRLG